MTGKKWRRWQTDKSDIIVALSRGGVIKNQLLIVSHR